MLPLRLQRYLKSSVTFESFAVLVSAFLSVALRCIRNISAISAAMLFGDSNTWFKEYFDEALNAEVTGS